MASFVTAATSAPNSKYFSKLANTRVLVIGGSAGIGKAVAEAAVEHGAIVVIASSSEQRLAAAVADIAERYPDRKEYITSHACDLAQKDKLEANLESLLTYAAKAGPAGNDQPEGIDHVVFTAGDGLKPSPLADITLDDVELVARIRLHAAIILAKLCLRYVKNSASSSVTLTSGSGAIRPIAGMGVYAATLGMSLDGLVTGMVVDMKPIRANLVRPGVVPTELWTSLWQGDALDAALVAMRQKTTTGTLGTPEDMAEAYLYLMKDKFATGVKIDTNGGSFFT
jgi:NAD(P)-dependent dehydrogenase (short-subunit alcohol dehydrogenase family)